MLFSIIITEPLGLAELERRMDVLAALGFAGIELTGRWPMPFPPRRLAAAAQSRGLRVVSLLSGWSYGHEGLCLASPDRAIRRRAVARLGDYLAYGAELDAITVVGLMQGLTGDEPHEAAAKRRIEECLRAAAERARGAGATLVLEPVNHLQVGFHHTAAEAAALVKRIGSPHLSYMLDTIHVHIEERSILDTIRAHGPRIRHFHLCETNGGPFGHGSLNLPAVLKALHATGYRHAVSVKVYRLATWESAARGAARALGLGPRRRR